MDCYACWSCLTQLEVQRWTNWHQTSVLVNTDVTPSDSVQSRAALLNALTSVKVWVCISTFDISDNIYFCTLTLGFCLSPSWKVVPQKWCQFWCVLHFGTWCLWCVYNHVSFHYHFNNISAQIAPRLQRRKSWNSLKDDTYEENSGGQKELQLLPTLTISAPLPGVMWRFSSGDCPSEDCTEWGVSQVSIKMVASF